MEKERKIKMLQAIYTGVLAETTNYFGKTGVLKEVREQKRQIHLQQGMTNAEKFGIKKPEDVFVVLPEIFNCVQWELSFYENGFKAEASSCLLCSMAKKIGAQRPCELYCLDSMEGMIKGLNPDMKFIVQKTLWQDDKCLLEVMS